MTNPKRSISLTDTCPPSDDQLNAIIRGFDNVDITTDKIASGTVTGAGNIRSGESLPIATRVNMRCFLLEARKEIERRESLGVWARLWRTF